MYKILVLALEGVVDSSLALTLDAAHTANRIQIARGRAAPLQTTLFSPGRKRIRTGLGATYSVRPRVQAGRYDALVVPGLGLATPNDIDAALSQRTFRTATDWLRDNGARIPLIAASCSGVFLLGEAGLLEGHRATTSWWLSTPFRERFPAVELDESRMTIESEGVLTAGAALAQMDLMLHLIARAVSPGTSQEVSRYLAIDRRPSQARFMMMSAVAGLPKEMLDIERWIRRNLSRAFSIAELASALGMSPRTLDRRIRSASGTGPSKFIQKVRVEQAAHLIETTDLGLAEIARQVGYDDAGTLRRLIQRSLGASPSEIRTRARQLPA